MSTKKAGKPIMNSGSGLYKIRSVGGGLSITLPHDFVKAEDLEAGQWVKIFWSNHALKIELVWKG